MAMRKPADDARVMPAGPFDGPVIAALQNELFPEQPWSQASVASLLDTPGTYAFLAAGRAYGETMPVGYALARAAADEAEILSLGVLPEARRGGLGTRLLEAAADRVRAAGAATLHLEVRADNDAALGLYRAAGFAEAGRRAGYYRRPDGPPVDAVTMSRPA